MSVAKQGFDLHYFINSPSGISLNPVESDNMANAVIMKHFVGTLVRYSNGGQFFPYLAEKFKSSENGLAWTFNLRSALRCADGEVITAQGYIDGLEKVLRMYVHQGPLPVLSDIRGWDEFLKGKKLVGLEAVSKNVIKFSFDKVAGPGFLEYLSMPYYGYYCGSNFNGNTWRDNLHIVSSSSYKLDKPLHDNHVVSMDKRIDWPLNPEYAPLKVIFATSVDENSWKTKWE